MSYLFLDNSYYYYYKCDFKNRFKRLMGNKIWARKKEVKKYEIIKEINIYDVVDYRKKEMSRNVIE